MKARKPPPATDNTHSGPNWSPNAPLPKFAKDMIPGGVEDVNAGDSSSNAVRDYGLDQNGRQDHETGLRSAHKGGGQHGERESRGECKPKRAEGTHDPIDEKEPAPSVGR